MYECIKVGFVVPASKKQNVSESVLKLSAEPITPTGQNTAFWSLHSLTSRVCPVKSLPQNSHLARRWGHVYLRWSSIRTRGICAPHLLVQGTASCLHVLRWACQKKPIFSITMLSQCRGSLAIGGIIQWLLSGCPCSLTVQSEETEKSSDS